MSLRPNFLLLQDCEQCLELCCQRPQTLLLGDESPEDPLLRTSGTLSPCLKPPLRLLGFFKTFYFEVIIESQEVAKNREVWCALHPVSPRFTRYIIIVQNQDQEFGIGPMS